MLSSFNGKTEAQIKDHIGNAFDRSYALGGLASLKQLGLVEFPLNATHKVIKSEIESAVMRHLGRIL